MKINKTAGPESGQIRVVALRHVERRVDRQWLAVSVSSIGNGVKKRKSCICHLLLSLLKIKVRLHAQTIIHVPGRRDACGCDLDQVSNVLSLY